MPRRRASRIARALGAVALCLATLLAGCEQGGGYERRGGGWTYDDTAFEPLDAATLQPLDRHFARDARRGYYRGRVIADSDGASFERLSAHEARDRHAVYWADTERKPQEYWAYAHVRIRRIDGADPGSYQVLPHGHARDRQRVYYEGRPFAVRDVASFEPLDRLLARDAQRGYFDRTEVPGSHGPSFGWVDPGESLHARDRERVWCLFFDLDPPDGHGQPTVRLLQGARPDQVRVPGQGYAVDGARVWHRGRLLAGADGASFEVVGDGVESDARDARHRYLRGRRLP